MNRTETNEETEWRNASHPRLVERLDNQRKEITRLTAEIVRLSGKTGFCAECVALTKRAEKAEKEIESYKTACIMKNEKVFEYSKAITEVQAERDAAIARAEKAEKSLATKKMCFDVTLALSKSETEGRQQAEAKVAEVQAIVDRHDGVFK